MSETKKIEHWPTIKRLIAEGKVYLGGHIFIGKAWDGAEVRVGDLTTKDDTESYLSENPNPTDW